MRLKEYFKEVQEIKLSDKEKLAIYNKIFSKPQKISIFKKSSFYFKTVGYFAVLFLFFVSIYIPYIKNIGIDTNDLLDKKYGSGYIVGKIDTPIDIVHASPIGKIIEINGEFTILKGDKEVNSNIIDEGDVVILLSGSNMKFEVNSGAMATIKGPARFTLQTVSKDDKNIYVLDLTYGQYFEIKSKDENTDQIVVKTEKMEVQLDDKDEKNKNIDFSITTNGDTQILNNKGSKLVVKKIIDNKEVKSEVKTNQKAQIDEQIKILEEVKKIETEIKEDKIENTYAFTGNNDLEEEIEYTVYSGNVKKSLNTDKMLDFKQLTYPSFIRKEIQSIYVAYLNGNQESLELANKTFISRLIKISKLIDIKLDDSLNDIEKLSTEDLFLATQNFVSDVKNKYYIPTKYTDRLDKTSIWLGKLISYEYGMFGKENLDFDTILDKIGLSKDFFIIN